MFMLKHYEMKYTVYTKGEKTIHDKLLLGGYLIRVHMFSGDMYVGEELRNYAQFEERLALFLL